jgi:hypothetical protein
MLENVPSLDGFFAQTQSKLSAACVEVGEAVRARIAAPARVAEHSNSIVSY